MENNNNFQELLLEGEFNKNVLDSAIKHLGNIKTLEYKCSNCLSFVFISKEKNVVAQYYVYKITSDKIKNIFDIINTYPDLISKKICFKKDTYEINFDVKNYLANLLEYKQEDNIIIWEKHLCLNSFSKDKLANIIINNIVKFIWDISKALYGLHSLSIMHGDPTIDNIAIRNSNFILFDYDSSKIDKNFTAFNRDNWELIKSIKFNIGKEEWDNILKEYPFITESESLLNDMLMSISKNTHKDIGTIIKELNSLSIIY
jgi:hypothetical protein